MYISAMAITRVGPRREYRDPCFGCQRPLVQPPKHSRYLVLLLERLRLGTWSRLVISSVHSILSVVDSFGPLSAPKPHLSASQVSRARSNNWSALVYALTPLFCMEYLRPVDINLRSQGACGAPWLHTPLAQGLVLGQGYPGRTIWHGP